MATTFEITPILTSNKINFDAHAMHVTKSYRAPIGGELCAVSVGVVNADIDVVDVFHFYFCNLFFYRHLA
jgi:hypothetical protein